MNAEYDRAMRELRRPFETRPEGAGPAGSIAINGDIREDRILETLGKVQEKYTNQLFDVITSDFPHNIQFKTRKGKTFLPF